MYEAFLFKITGNTGSNVFIASSNEYFIIYWYSTFCERCFFATIRAYRTQLVKLSTLRYKFKQMSKRLTFVITIETTYHYINAEFRGPVLDKMQYIWEELSFINTNNVSAFWNFNIFQKKRSYAVHFKKVVRRGLVFGVSVVMSVFYQ